MVNAKDLEVQLKAVEEQLSSNLDSLRDEVKTGQKDLQAEFESF